MADNLLDKASILLTPTAYNDGSMLSVKPENGDGDFTFSRSSAATRVNAQGLVENVQIISSELVSNGNFSQIGTEEVTNGNFSQEGSEQVTNGDFSNGYVGWNLSGNPSNYSVEVVNYDGKTDALHFTTPDNNNGVNQIILQSNKQYLVKFDLKVISGNVYVGKAGNNVTGGTLNPSEWTSYEEYWTSSDEYFRVYSSGSAEFYLDNVSVKEVGQDWTLLNGSISDKYNASMTAYQSGIKITPFFKTGKYKVVFDLVVTSGSCKFDAGGGNDEIYTTSGTKEKLITNPTKFEFNAFNLGWVGTLDNISVKEVGQDWTFGTGWSVDQANSKATCDGSQSIQSNLYQAGIVPINKTYKVTFSTAVTSGSLVLAIGGSNPQPTVTTSGTYTYTSKTTIGDSNLYFSASSDFIGSITNVSIKEITDDTDLPRINYEGFSYQDSLGSQLITNGDFSNGYVGWNLSGNPSNYSVEVVNYDGKTDALHFTTPDNNNGVNQIILQSNKQYLVKFDLKVISGNVYVGKAGNNVTGGTLNPSEWTSYEEYWTSSDEYFRVYSSGSAEFYLDNVSVKEVGQDWTLLNGSISDKYNASMTAYQSGIKITPFFKTGKYKVVFDLVVTSGSCKFDAGGGNDEIYTTSGTKEKLITNPTKFEFNAFNLGWVGTLDNISVKEVGQDWTFGTGWSVDQANSKATCDGSQSIQSNLYQAGIVPINKTYKVTFSTAVTSGSLVLAIGGSNPQPTVTTSGTYTYTSKTTIGDSNLYFSASSDFIGSITNVSIKEITDDTDLPRINYEGFSYQDVLGSEEVAGGDFSYDSGWNGQKTIANGQLTKDNSGLVYKSILDVSVKAYKVVVDVDTLGSSLTIYLGGAQQSLSVGVNTIDMQSGGSNAFVGFNNGDGSIINSISVKEVIGQEVVPDSGCGSWLLEPQSTNLVTYSEDFSNSAWTKINSTEIIPNNSISPNGSLNSDQINAPTAYNGLLAFQDGFSVSSNSNYSVSFFAKKGNLKYLQLFHGGGQVVGNARTNFDLENGAVAVSDSGHDASIEDYGNGWFRCIVFLETLSTALQLYFSAVKDVNAARSGTSDFNEDDNLFIWGAQLEQQSYATSYIPTNGATNTRLQDIANNSGNSTLINSTEGTLYVEMSALQNGYLSLTDGSSTNRIFLGFDSSSVYTQIRVGGAVQADMITSAYPSNTILKAAVKYKVNDFALWVNGVEVNTDTSGSTFPSEVLNNLSFDVGGGNFPFYGNIKALAVYKEALTDAQLQSLTTI